MKFPDYNEVYASDMVRERERERGGRERERGGEVDVITAASLPKDSDDEQDLQEEEYFSEEDIEDAPGTKRRRLAVSSVQ